ncbi:MAG: hypothetical protein Q9210_004949 [Variospora velana]
MDSQDARNVSQWAHQVPSRPPSNVSYNAYGPSTSNSPAHGNTPMPQYPPQYGPPYHQMNERQRMMYDYSIQNRQNAMAQPSMNGGGHRPYAHFSGHSQYSGRPTSHPFRPQNIPGLPPADSLNERQREARELIIKLNADKKDLLDKRKKTAAELKRLQMELDGYEANQRGQEFLRFIYPTQARIAEVQGTHDGLVAAGKELDFPHLTKNTLPNKNWIKWTERLRTSDRRRLHPLSFDTLRAMSVSDTNQQIMDSRSRKRRRISVASPKSNRESEGDVLEVSSADWTSARNKSRGSSTKTISPPPSRKADRGTETSWPTNGTGGIETLLDNGLGQPYQAPQNPHSRPSPIQLSTVSGLPASSNIDTVSLGDILGDPLIKECWLFNYLFDVDFIMSQLDEDTRDLVQVKLVHGSWKNEDSNRMHIENRFAMLIRYEIQQAAKRYPNIQVVTAYMAEIHDDQAQVIIITGNFIVRDWSMCQAVWRSPLLPLVDNSIQSPSDPEALPTGSGSRFKKDLLAYFKAYGSKRTSALTAQLERYEFSSIRAALIASVPGKQNLRSTDREAETLWGWPGLREILRSITSASAGGSPRIVMQCSSVASISEKWMANFLETLSVTTPPNVPQLKQTPKVSLVFPTASEIRRSVDGYSSGGSIHMKTQTPAQQKQLTYLRPMLCRWARDYEPSAPPSGHPDVGRLHQALRRRAAPHIKTYIRFADEEMDRIDWAMMTSANLSKQAWGDIPTAGSEIRICSYEIGVVVWPDLWDEGAGVDMVPVFGKDIPDDKLEAEEVAGRGHEEDETTDEEGGAGFRKENLKESKSRKLTVGLRMPYDLPLVPYGQNEMPWCASTPCAEPDWKGRVWPGFGSS